MNSLENPIPDLVNFYFHVYDMGSIPYYAPFLEHDGVIDIESLMDAEPEFVTYGFEFLTANEEDPNYEDMKALQRGKIDYLVIGSSGGSFDCYVLVSSPEAYKSFVEYMMTNPVTDYSIPADADYIIDNIRNPNAFVYVKGKPHMVIEARKGKLPFRDSIRHNPYNAVEELTMYCELDSYEVVDLMKEFYPKSVLTPNEFIAENSKYSDTHIYYSADFAWIGTKGRTLRIRPSDAGRVTPVDGNIFDDEKICAVAEAPAVFDFQIPFFVGYCEVRIIDGEEMREYEDYTDYYHYDEDDDGEIEITIRDGNHRTFGALASGNDAYVIISDNQYQDYENWIKSGKPANLLYEWLEDNLI
jgi:hypothetical protein